jgi:hypothetical protein
MRDRTFVTHSFSFELFVVTKPRKQRNDGNHHPQCAGVHVFMLDDSSFASLYLTFSTRRVDAMLINQTGRDDGGTRCTV